MFAQLRPALVALVVLTVLTGFLYPLAMTGLAQQLFPYQANGSQIFYQGKVIGSRLIGQAFDDPQYFWGRPSATSPHPYNAAASAGSNLGPTNPALSQAVKKRIEILRSVDPGNLQPVPVDLVTASASGLDPEISVAAAQYQAPRVARLRHLPLESVQELIFQHTQERQWGFLGERRVNVLELNLALEALK